MLTRKTALKEAGNFLADLKAFGYTPVKAVLFGSMVTGRQHAWSDIDLAVWDEHFLGPIAMDYEKILPVLRPYRNLELHPFHPEETAESNPFIAEILRTGIEVEV
jgi:predicted nucleotidyltransferase